MESTAYWRRQAEFCLRLSQFCSDMPVAEHLRMLAARYHENALRVEFDAFSGADGAQMLHAARWPAASGATP